MANLVRKYLQNKLKIEPEKTKTLSAGANTLKVVALNTTEQYKWIAFVIADMDLTGALSLIVSAAPNADGSGTLIDIHTIAVGIANDQTCVLEVDMGTVLGACDLASGGIEPKALVLRVTGATNTNTLALCTVSETMFAREGLTPSSVAVPG